MSTLPSGDILLEGGNDSAGNPITDPAWTWDGTTWSQVTATLETQYLVTSQWSDGAVAFDQSGASGHYIARGGVDVDRTDHCHPWPGPLARKLAHFAFDDANVTSVLFGGSDGSVGNSGTTYNDTWILSASGSGFTFTNAFPVHKPPTTEGGSFAFDSLHKKFFLFGGRVDDINSEGLDTTWAFDGTDWTDVSSAVRPPKRLLAAGTFDPTRARFIVHGGGHRDVLRSDTWEFDGTNWAPLDDVSSIARYWHAMAYSPKTKRMTMFGGFNGVTLNDTRELHLYGEACNDSTTCYTGTACSPEHVCCTDTCTGGQVCNTPGDPGHCAAP